MHLRLFLPVAILLISLDAATSASAAQRGGDVPLSEPRIPRVEKPWTEAERAILEPRARDDGSVLGVWSTCAQSPELCEAWLTFTDYVLRDSTLPLRDRELLILRIGWLNGGAYEWSAHLGVAKRARAHAGGTETDCPWTRRSGMERVGRHVAQGSRRVA